MSGKSEQVPRHSPCIPSLNPDCQTNGLGRADTQVVPYGINLLSPPRMERAWYPAIAGYGGEADPCTAGNGGPKNE